MNPLFSCTLWPRSTSKYSLWKSQVLQSCTLDWTIKFSHLTQTGCSSEAGHIFPSRHGSTNNKLCITSKPRLDSCLLPAKSSNNWTTFRPEFMLHRLNYQQWPLWQIDNRFYSLRIQAQWHSQNQQPYSKRIRPKKILPSYPACNRLYLKVAVA